MPIYAPTLPPKPDLSQGDHPALVLMRFDLRRILRQRLGRFFGFTFVLTLIVQIGVLYTQYLVDTSAGFAALRDFAHQVLSQGPEYQAGLLSSWLNTLMWFFVATVGGGLVARDTLYRVRPLMYAHPVRPLDYLMAKGGFAAALPLVIQLIFILLPWTISMLIAGKNGPIWPTTPLRLIPAALLNAGLFGSVVIGASSLAGTPKAGVAWVLGIVLGSSAIGGLLTGLLNQPAFMALSPVALAESWPRLFCSVPQTLLGWGPTILGTMGHIALWTFLTWKRTRPSEAVL